MITIIVMILTVLFLIVTTFVESVTIKNSDVCVKELDPIKPQPPKGPTPLPSLSKITDGIWISNYITSTKYDALKEHGVKQILSIGAELPTHKTNDFQLMHISIDDMPTVDISRYFDSTYDFIDAAPTLIHCAMGISRSVSIVLAYLIRKERMPLSQALALVKSKRPIAGPNSGFIQQLKNFEKKYVH